MPTIRSRVNVFVQVWFFVLMRTAVAGVVFGAVGCLVMVMVVGSNSAQNSGDLTRLLLSGMSAGLVAGTLLGGITGIIAGFSGGIVIGMLTALFFYPPRRSLIFRLVVHIVSLIACVSAVIAVVRFTLDFGESSSHPVLLDLVPAIFAALGSYWTIRRMIRWYMAIYFVPE
ncbi:MAG: hypothetical protein KF726_02770 [Anaerolineae bacterium]|nr:hypothetical protein [Anaerolineae bacterium]